MTHRYRLRVGERVIHLSARSDRACYDAAEDICGYLLTQGIYGEETSGTDAALVHVGRPGESAGDEEAPQRHQ